MNKLKITIIAIMVAITRYLILLPAQANETWFKWLSVALWVILIIIIALNSDLFERPKIEDKDPDGIEIDKNLKEFLIRKGAYEKFIANVNPARSPFYLIGTAFPWDKTPEGDDYWRKLDNEYYNEFVKEYWD